MDLGNMDFADNAPLGEQGWIGSDKVKTIPVLISDSLEPGEMLEGFNIIKIGGLNYSKLIDVLRGFADSDRLGEQGRIGSDKVKMILEPFLDSLGHWNMLEGFNKHFGLSVYRPLQMIGTPLLNKLTENKWQHHRGINSAFKDGSLQATQIHMVIAAEGTIDQPMYDVYIIDSGASLHCTGDRNLLTDYTPKEQPDESFRGASGKVMPVLGTGTICNGMFQVKDVKYMPSLNQLNVNKTIFSVVELGKLGYHVHFDGASCSVIDKRNRTWSWKTWTWTHEIVGKAHLECKQYMVDYLRIPADRVPVTNPEGPTLAASFWQAASSGWASVTRLLTQTQEVHAERLPV